MSHERETEKTCPAPCLERDRMSLSEIDDADEMQNAYKTKISDSTSKQNTIISLLILIYEVGRWW